MIKVGKLLSNYKNYTIKIKTSICFIFLLILTLVYAYFFPIQYVFSCTGLSMTTKYSLNDRKTVVKEFSLMDDSTYRKEEFVKIKKYLFGYHYTINFYEKKDCDYSDDDGIFCSKLFEDDYKKFDFYKMVYEEKISRVSEKTYDIQRFKGNCVKRESGLK